MDSTDELALGTAGELADGTLGALGALELPCAAASGFDPPLEQPATSTSTAATTPVTPRIAPPFPRDTPMLAAARRRLASS
ncbi:conserved hypothetical protein [Catenulispora acidiphila DSM 44928]|uniref:Uncharacterized protein n=1 Tax=Catenulispora acidiphila (strain DSM 44928 / JCM 14897 / NBRC 102108 / NRRL B-24433 / ID139908) TaxID=479433 RepID=C7Q3T7_CATAD|nr:hypothetical protein [Catenulispora acidiphila]ACU77695.1 conserved hypothetical protein [Catenulispora acidiphila DSM 44928]